MSSQQNGPTSVNFYPADMRNDIRDYDPDYYGMFYGPQLSDAHRHRQELAEALIGQGKDTSAVNSTAEFVLRVAQGLIGGALNSGLRKKEDEAHRKWDMGRRTVRTTSFSSGVPKNRVANNFNGFNRPDSFNAYTWDPNKWVDI